MADISAKSLIVDLLSASPEQRIPVGGLVRVAEVFGIAESSLRVALSRLCAAGTVIPVCRGEYSLSGAAAPLQRRVSSWRSATDDRVPWDGGWVCVHGPIKGRSKAALAERRALRLLGFAEVDSSLRVRPDNLRGGVAALRERLQGLGLGEAHLVGRLDALTDADVTRLAGHWDPRSIGAGHDAMREHLTSSAAGLLELPLDEALRESFHLGGEAIRQIVLDPLLPEELGDPAPLRALVRAMDDYDRLGRGLWEAFFGDAATRAPARDGGLPAESIGGLA
ncbi:MAG: hypothetical protein JJ863_37080 [Deltaproteobacteria bacterium]|nr:hypothetical protein [Deltaproteobacteria bacterium]